MAVAVGTGGAKLCLVAYTLLKDFVTCVGLTCGSLSLCPLKGRSWVIDYAGRGRPRDHAQ
jgi:hypothetical protein